MGISSKDDYKCWKMRRSDFEELEIHSWSLVSIRLTKSKLERRTVDKLSELLGWRSGWWERALGLVRRQPRTWIILRLKLVRSSNHQAWQWFKFLA